MRRILKILAGMMGVLLLGMSNPCGDDERPPRPLIIAAGLSHYSCCEAGEESRVRLDVYDARDVEIEVNPTLVSGTEQLDSHTWILDLPHCGGTDAADKSTYLVRLRGLSISGRESITEELTLDDLDTVPRCDCGDGRVEATEQCELRADCGIADCGGDCRCQFEPWSQSFREYCDTNPESCIEDRSDDFVTLANATGLNDPGSYNADIKRVAFLPRDAWPVVNLMGQIQLTRPYSDHGGVNYRRYSESFGPSPDSVYVFVEFESQVQAGTIPDTPEVPEFQFSVNLIVASEPGISIELPPRELSVGAGYSRGRTNGEPRERGGTDRLLSNFVFVQDEVVAFVVGKGLVPTIEEPRAEDLTYFGLLSRFEVQRTDGSWLISADVLGDGLDAAFQPLPPGISFELGSD